MKSLIVILFCGFLFSGCGSPSSDKTQNPVDGTAEKNPEEIALKYLYNKLKKDKSGTVTLSENEIKIENSTITLLVTPEFDSIRDSSFIYAADFSTTYSAGAVTTIHMGSVGIGTTREDAIQTAVDEWFAVFGLPFTNMLANDTAGPTISGFAVYPGLMGIRGTLPENTWLKGDNEMTKKIIGEITDQIKILDGRIVSVDLKLFIDKTGISSGECRINNQESLFLLNTLKKLDWPKSDPGFLFKQFYIIRKN